MKPDEKMCPGCAMVRDADAVKDEVCPWCGYNPNINARQRRAEKRSRLRLIRGGKQQ